MFDICNMSNMTYVKLNKKQNTTPHFDQLRSVWKATALQSKLELKKRNPTEQ